MNDLLFDVPWWIPTLLAVIGVSLYVNGNKRQITRVRAAGIALVLLAIGWTLLSYFVDTDKEKVARQTHRLVKDVVDGDWTNFKSQLSASVSFATKGGTIASGPDVISDYARTSAETIHVTSATIRDLKVKGNGAAITASFTLISTQESLTPVETSAWEFDWERTAEGWKAQSFRLMSLRDVPSDDLFRELIKAKH
jgi:hypothetical protein